MSSVNIDRYNLQLCDVLIEINNNLWTCQYKIALPLDHKTVIWMKEFLFMAAYV